VPKSTIDENTNAGSHVTLLATYKKNTQEKIGKRMLAKNMALNPPMVDMNPISIKISMTAPTTEINLEELSTSLRLLNKMIRPIIVRSKRKASPPV
jgi:ribosomal protein S6